MIDKNVWILSEKVGSAYNHAYILTVVLKTVLGLTFQIYWGLVVAICVMNVECENKLTVYVERTSDTI